MVSRNTTDTELVQVNTTHDVFSVSATAGFHIEELSPGLRATGTLLGSVLISFGLLGNALILISVILSKQLRKAANIPIASLGCSNFILILGVHTLYVHTYRLGYWSLGRIVCDYTGAISSAGPVNAILHMLLIAFYRYVLIVHPQSYNKIERKPVLTFLVGLCYAIPYGTAFATGLNNQVRSDRGIKKFSAVVMHCLEKGAGATSNLQAALTLFTIFFIILAFFYTRIYITVRKSARRVLAAGQNGGTRSGPQKKRMKAEVSLMKVMMVTFVLYTVSYIPWPVAFSILGDWSGLGWAYLPLNLLIWSASGTMWLVYGLMNKQFRDAYRSLLVCTKPIGSDSTAGTQSTGLPNNTH